VRPQPTGKRTFSLEIAVQQFRDHREGLAQGALERSAARAFALFAKRHRIATSRAFITWRKAKTVSCPPTHLGCGSVQTRPLAYASMSIRTRHPDCYISLGTMPLNLLIACSFSPGVERVAQIITRRAGETARDFVIAARRHLSMSAIFFNYRHTRIPMTRVLTMIAVGVLILLDTQAIAVDPIGQSTMGKRQAIVQVINCMKKRMSVNKEISYNAAAKVCKNLVTNQNNNSASVAVVASDSPAKP